MRRFLITVVAGAMLLSACGGDDDAADGVASLDEVTTTTMAATDRVSDNEQAVLAFTACLRENGLDDLPDPRMDENGNVDLESFLEIATQVDPDDADVAVQACADLLDDIELGFDQIDFTGLQDTLVEFSACMRDNGFDLPDPDFSNLANLQGDGPFGPIDVDDPAFQAALESCDQILANITLTGDGE